jgi:hypothetical protein
VVLAGSHGRHVSLAARRRAERPRVARGQLPDRVNVTTGRVSDSRLSLDQGMIMAALGNALGHDVLRRAFTDRQMARTQRRAVGVERFNDSPPEAH